MFQHFEHVLARTVFCRSRRPNIIFTTLVALRGQPKNCLCERGLPTDIEAGRIGTGGRKRNLVHAHDFSTTRIKHAEPTRYGPPSTDPWIDTVSRPTSSQRRRTSATV